MSPPLILPCISPVRDAMIVNNVYGDNRDVMYLACGSRLGSNIREIRHGVKCTIESNIEIEGATGLWALGDILVVSFLLSTRALRLDMKGF